MNSFGLVKLIVISFGAILHFIISLMGGLSKRDRINLSFLTPNCSWFIRFEFISFTALFISGSSILFKDNAEKSASIPEPAAESK